MSDAVEMAGEALGEWLDGDRYLAVAFAGPGMGLVPTRVPVSADVFIETYARVAAAREPNSWRVTFIDLDERGHLLDQAFTMCPVSHTTALETLAWVRELVSGETQQ